MTVGIIILLRDRVIISIQTSPILSLIVETCYECSSTAIVCALDLVLIL